MVNRLKKTVLICFFLLGLAVFCYPYARGLIVRHEMESTVQTFQEQKETQPTTVVISDSTEPSEQRQYADLWENMTAYNETIFAQGQSIWQCPSIWELLHSTWQTVRPT